MGLAKYTFYLNGFESSPPKNWRGLETLATFISSDDGGVRTSESVQPNITIDEFTFVNQEAKNIIQYRKGGLVGGTGIFEGFRFKIDVSDGTTTSTVLDSYIDFKNGYKELSPVEVVCKIKQFDSLNSLDGRVRVNSFEYLERIKVFKQSDSINIPYIIQRLDNEPELAMLQLTLSMFIIQAAQLVKEILKDIGTIGAIASTVLGIPGSLLLAILTLALDIAFLIVLVAEMLKILKDMILLIAPPVQFHKATYLHTLLEKAFDFLGYKFETGIEELSQIAYLPKKGSGIGSIKSGVPKLGESGESISDVIGIVLKMFNGRIAIIDNTIHIRWENDSFWVRNSLFTLKDVGNFNSGAQNLESEEFVFNTNDFNANTYLAFLSDTSDKWTLEDDEGIDVQVIREPINLNDKRKLLFDGSEDIRIPCALASRKDFLSEPEKLLEQIQIKFKPILDQANDVFNNQVGANLNNVTTKTPSNFATLLNYLNTTGREGAMKIDAKTYSVPKLVLLEETSDGLKIPKNHRKILGAKALYDKYYISNSFANSNKFKAQRRLFIEREVPFTYQDFLKVNNNSYFATADGLTGKFDSVKWRLDADTAIVDYWIEEVYTENIKETIIESP